MEVPIWRLYCTDSGRRSPLWLSPRLRRAGDDYAFYLEYARTGKNLTATQRNISSVVLYGADFEMPIWHIKVVTTCESARKRFGAGCGQPSRTQKNQCRGSGNLIAADPPLSALALGAFPTPGMAARAPRHPPHHAGPPATPGRDGQTRPHPAAARRSRSSPPTCAAAGVSRPRRAWKAPAIFVAHATTSAAGGTPAHGCFWAWTNHTGSGKTDPNQGRPARDGGRHAFKRVVPVLGTCYITCIRWQFGVRKRLPVPTRHQETARPVREALSVRARTHRR